MPIYEGQQPTDMPADVRVGDVVLVLDFSGSSYAVSGYRWTSVQGTVDEIVSHRQLNLIDVTYREHTLKGDTQNPQIRRHNRHVMLNPKCVIRILLTNRPKF